MTAREFFQGRWMQHPVHPLLVHVPVGAWVLALVFDLIAFGGGGNSFVRASQYCIVGGLAGAALAAIFGMGDMLTRTHKSTEPRRLALTHMSLNGALFVAYLVNAILRGREMALARPPALPFLLSLVGVVVLGVAGYIGGSLIYRHGIGLTLEKTTHEEREKLGHLIRERPAEV